MGKPRFRPSRAHKKVTRRTGTSISLTATTKAELAAATNGPGTGLFDVKLAGSVGDDIELTLSGLLDSSAPSATFDAATRVAGADVNFATGGTAMGTNTVWVVPGGAVNNLTGTIVYTLQAGDLDTDGFFTFRPYYLCSAGTGRTLYTTATDLFMFYVKNLGPADPD